MSEKRFPGYDLQLVNRDDVESGGQLIESNIESLAERNGYTYFYDKLSNLVLTF